MAALLVTGLVTGLAPAAAAQTPVLPASLAGEQFYGDVDTSADCAPTGESRIQFSSRGTAIGPYPGTYEESGAVTIGEQTLPNPFSVLGGALQVGPLVELKVSFTITSAAGRVSGTKTITTREGFPSYGICSDTQPSRDFDEFCRTFNMGTGARSQRVREVFTPVRYEAVINPVGSWGAFRDSGQGDLTFSEINGVCDTADGGTIGVGLADNLQERFLSSNGVRPLNTPGKATGGGQIAGTDQTSRIAFGFEAISTQGENVGDFRFQGHCLVEDKVRTTMVKCLNVTSYSQVGTHATFRGEAEVNGERTEYTIDVDDIGEPNQGKDTFKIVTDSGYSAAGNVPDGDVQVFVEDGPQG